MSWNIRATGTKERVKEILAAEPTLPEDVRQFIGANIDATSLFGPHNGIFVNTYGHKGGPGSTFIEIQPIRL